MPQDQNLRTIMNRAEHLKREGRIDEHCTLLRMAAEAGHATAAAQLGWLHSFAPEWNTIDLFDDPRSAQRSPAESLLRQARGLDPDDGGTATLLAALLLWQLREMRACDPYDGDWVDEVGDEEEEPEEIWATAIQARHNEAVRLLEHVLRADPTNASAAVGLLAVREADWTSHLIEHSIHQPPLPDSDLEGRRLLEEMVTAARQAVSIDPGDSLAVGLLATALRWQQHPEAVEWSRRFQALRTEIRWPEETPGERDHDRPTHGRYSWYLLEITYNADPLHGDVVTDTVVTGDLDVLRWACDHHLAARLKAVLRDGDGDGDCGSVEVAMFEQGELVANIDLTPHLQLGDNGAVHIDWMAGSLPSLALAGESLPPGHPVTDASRMAVISYGHTDGASPGWHFGTIIPA
ncbi:hypothetical protein [Nonomuraea gerenzanensis]|uniref:hypothetical protein n=1 Tax=Nonomuraea gerenzanensis TaxID=93944 RepID=UPI001CDA1D85|nr:hypothetical protein [Nonomuraea gerenzanensis]UBU17818.1 hypothetical protein LCN96_23170 [Nonomuraea gerenzanensis]